MSCRSELSLPVRYADTDAQGHVFFANYFTYADEGLTACLAQLGCSYAWLETVGIDLVYVSSSCQHRGSARFGDVLTIYTTITRIGRTSLTTTVEVCRGEDVLAALALVSVCLDATTRRPCPAPEKLRAACLAVESGDMVRREANLPDSA
ncbi:MAG: thioesterase family protein [Myxococcota bacterium]|nr:thioesterase family protein [Myxococcota bacterium]